METFLRPATVIGGSLLLALLLGWTTDRLLRKAATHHPDTPLWTHLRQTRLPLQLLLCATFLRTTYTTTNLPDTYRTPLTRTLTLLLIASTAWLIVRITSAAVETSFTRYATARPDRDPARIRRVRTQVSLIMRVVAAIVGVVAAAAMLLTFPEMRAAGASILASAGIIGIVAGVAAQSTLSNMFAGFQIAFGDMVRLGDTVVVDGEWGVVEDITLTYLTVRTWDDRRITMPVSYFTSKPFQNWSRGGTQLTGTVYFQLDHSAPLDEMRTQLRDILRACEQWDGRDYSLSMTDSTPTTIEVRALMTAKDSDDIWKLRVTVREKMIRWLFETHPYALPRVNTADAAPPPPDPR